MIREDLIAERIATDSCREMVPYDRIDDPTTRTVLEGSLIGKRKPVIGVGNLASMLTGFRATTGRLKAIFIGRERVPSRMIFPVPRQWQIRPRVDAPAQRRIVMNIGTESWN